MSSGSGGTLRFHEHVIIDTSTSIKISTFSEMHLDRRL